MRSAAARQNLRGIFRRRQNLRGMRSLFRFEQRRRIAYYRDCQKNVPIEDRFSATTPYAAILISEHYYGKRYNTQVQYNRMNMKRFIMTGRLKLPMVCLQGIWLPLEVYCAGNRKDQIPLIIKGMKMEV
jgi:hypothetical protein